MVARTYSFSDFDPSWSFDEARAHMDLAKGRSCPFMRWEHWRALHEEIKTHFESGNPRTLLLAVRDCACFDLPLPDWVAEAYILSFDRWNLLEAGSLDEAFAVKKPKGFQLAANNRNSKLSTDIGLAVHSAHLRGEAIDSGLFEKIGEQLNVSAGTVSRLYYDENSTGSMLRKLRDLSILKKS